ncbi:CYTH and CHAD domain-containing protein [Microvirga terricola]|uniref:CHAD domain-containing protein n=1 Tax=Microvirga terricola TaxID=2719797 RepID=A0ABX0VCE9_9HYPH|nr:CYTH and CHAD domain-containing protein [Microvirga terricola]NIX77347.1 CHAD domain-containing protein [Microvirga terricola]
MPSDQEFEIKLQLSDEAADKLATMPQVATAQLRTAHLQSVYFDTHSRALQKAGLQLRIRQDGPRRVQTVKAGHGVVRGEWEREVEGQLPDLGAATGSPAERLLKKRKVRNDLIPLFWVDIERRKGLLLYDGAEIELAIDRGRVVTGNDDESICEAELELKQGEPEALFELARALGGPVKAAVSVVSKGDRGYRLASGTSQTPERDLLLSLNAGESTATAIQSILRACLRQLSVNDGLLRQTRAEEPLHRTRVAVRRIRAALSLFKPILVGREADEIRAGFKWISDLLGEARDLDVFLAKRLDQVRLQHEHSPGFEDLRRQIRDRREHAYDQLLAALVSERYFNLMLATQRTMELGEWLSDPDSVARLHRTQPIEVYAADELQRRFASVMKAGQKLARLDAKRRHRVRIKAKKLRYMAEFLQSLAPRKPYTDLDNALHDLQRSLGKLNDAIVGREFMVSISGDTALKANPQASFAAGIVAGATTTPEKQMILAEKAIKRLSKRRPFWHKF